MHTRKGVIMAKNQDKGEKKVKKAKIKDKAAKAKKSY
jgi:hypothetical protein